MSVDSIPLPSKATDIEYRRQSLLIVHFLSNHSVGFQARTKRSREFTKPLWTPHCSVTMALKVRLVAVGVASSNATF